MKDIEPLLLSILGAVSSVLTPPPGRVVLAPGAEVAHDDCCAGQVWVRLVALTPAPAAASTAVCPIPLWTVFVEAGAVRCAHVINDAGEPPTPTDLLADSVQMLADMTALGTAIDCVVRGLEGVERLTMTRWDPLGPSGGCVGGSWQFSVSVLS